MPQSDVPLRKVTMNFFRSDIEYLEATYGMGWSEQIRLWVNQRVKQRKEAQERINNDAAR